MSNIYHHAPFCNPKLNGTSFTRMQQFRESAMLLIIDFGKLQVSSCCGFQWHDVRIELLWFPVSSFVESGQVVQTCRNTQRAWWRVFLSSKECRPTILICSSSHLTWPPLSFWLQIQRSRVRSPHFLGSSNSGTGSTQPREDNWGATWMEK
jgi:hypothetical protein